MNLTEYALKNKALVYFFVFVLVVGGVYAFMTMSKLEDPAITVKQAMVVTAYPGASAFQVELEVTDLLEKSIRSMGDLDHVESRSMDDVSEILVELSSTVPLEELQQKWDILRHKVENVQGQLPQGAQPSTVLDDFGDVYGMFYAMVSDGFGYQEMMDYAQLVRRTMLDIDGVSSVDIYGEHQPCVNIEVQEDKMANLGVHPAEVILTLKSQNQTVYSGYYNSGDKRIRVGVDGNFRSLEDIRNLLIKGHEDDNIRLGDVARIEHGYAEPSREGLLYDTIPGIAISIAMEKGGNIIQLGKKVDRKLEELKTEIIPAGIDFKKVFFQPARVKSAINVFMVNLVESVVIVIFIVMLFMGFRSGYIIGVSLVIVVLGSFVVLHMMHGTLQRVSLASFIIAMGMLVDNAIVIVDGIMVDLQKGIGKPEALVNIAKKTGWPLLGATTIGILTFLPIYLSPDTTGEYVRDLFIVLAVSLWLSWILALAYAPLQADRVLKTAGKTVSEKELYKRPVYRMYRNALQFSIYNRWRVIIAVVVLLAVSVWGYRFIRQGFFPDLSYNQLYIEYQMPYGTNPETVKSDLASMERYLMSRPEITAVTTSLGGTPSRYNLVRTVAEPALSYGELIVDFTSPATLKDNLPELQKYLSEHYPEGYVRMKRYNLMYMNFPIQFMIAGPDPAVLKSLCGQVEQIMREDSSAMLVTNDWGPATPVLDVRYSQQIAREAGISRQDVSLALLAATEGLPVASYYEGEHALPVYIKTVDAGGERPERIGNVPVWSLTPSVRELNMETVKELMTGMVSTDEIVKDMIGSVPLNRAADGVGMKWEIPLVRRYNGQRSISAQCNNAPGFTTAEVRNNILAKIDTLTIPPGYTTEWQGEYLASTQSEQYLFKNVPIAIVLVIAILIGLFRDFRKPVMILLCLPLAVTGIVAGMLLAGKEFGFVAIVGALGLVGMMIKNGVVLVDEVGIQINEGKEPFRALLDASSSRLRPVLLAALTTILGMIPLVNDDMFGALAVTIMGGLLVGTIITLVVLPVLYSLFYRIRHPRRKRGHIIRIRMCFLILSLFWFFPEADAQVILNLRQCREMALENSKQIAVARKQLEKAEAETKAYRAGYFPRFSVTGQGFYNQEKYSYKLKGGYLPTYVLDENGTWQPNVVKEYAFLPDIGIKVGMRGVYTVGAQLQQPVYMGGKIRTAHKMSKIGETMANENIRLNRSEVYAETDKCYWQLLGVEEQVKAAEAYRQALGELLKTVGNARSVGMATGNDVLKVQVRCNEADLLVQKAKNGLVLSRMNLCRIIGLDLQTDIAIQDSLSETIQPGILAQPAELTQRPDYNLLQEETVLKEKEIHLVRADFLPQIGVTAGYGYGGGLELNGDRESKASFNALACVEIPLFNWGEGRNKSKAARAGHEISRLNLEKSAQWMELEITSARFNIQDARTRIEMAKNALLQAEENLRVSNDQYKVGMESLSDLLEAQAQWQEAQSQWVEAKAALKMSETQYLKAIGKLAE